MVGNKIRRCADLRPRFGRADFCAYLHRGPVARSCPQGSVQELKWRRDTLDGWTITVQVPPGQKQVEATLDFLSPAQFEGGFSAGSSATAQMAVVSWNQVLLHPLG